MNPKVTKFQSDELRRMRTAEFQVRQRQKELWQQEQMEKVAAKRVKLGNYTYNGAALSALA